MNKKLIRQILAVIALALLFPIAIGVAGEELRGVLSSSSSSSSSSSVVVFYNAKEEVTALYVQKKVENASDRYPAPEDDEFEFTLRLNGEVDRDHPYALYDEEGRRIYVYEGEDGVYQTTEEDPTQLEAVLKTDRYGHFYLLAGQVARFTGLIPGDNYEITESEADGYELVSPASEDRTLTGTMTIEGAKETFTNLYTKGTPGTLEVRKKVSFPKGYQLPETPAFTFAVSIGGEPLADKAYVVKDIETKKKLADGTTNSEGRLTLQGDTYAYFEDIPEDVDYSVQEILDESAAAAGWRVVGDSVQEGATGSEGTVTTFTNVLASFAVTKTIINGDAPDEVFTFQVLDGEGKEPLGGPLSYYLYDNALQLIDTELHQTTDDGIFKLNTGVRAVFVGLPAGTAYSVRETDSGAFLRFQPTDERGYLDKVVTDAVEILPFVNMPGSEGNKLLVEKTMENHSRNKKVPDEEFPFRLSRKEADGSYSPMAGVPYDITDTSGTRTYTTDEDGRFTMRAWETAQFLDLEEGFTYRVEELKEELPDGFAPDGEGVVEGTLGDGKLQIQMRNIYNGTPLPFIGGIGTLRFYVIGALLILAGGTFAILWRRKKAAAAGTK